MTSPINYADDEGLDNAALWAVIDSAAAASLKHSPETRSLTVTDYKCNDSPSCGSEHSLSGWFPTVSLFKEYQHAAMAILEKSDYTMISGSPFIKKSGWRKISFYFNVSYEIRDKTIEFDESRNVLRAEFVVRALMQGGRFSDGWGSCECREKRFVKPNHDIPSTAETRAKNKHARICLELENISPRVPVMFRDRTLV